MVNGAPLAAPPFPPGEPSAPCVFLDAPAAVVVGPCGAVAIGPGVLSAAGLIELSTQAASSSVSAAVATSTRRVCGIQVPLSAQRGTPNGRRVRTGMPRTRRPLSDLHRDNAD